MAVLDMTWPDGLPQRLSEPVAVLLNEPLEIEEAAYRAGYRFFRSAEELKAYVLSEILVETRVVRASHTGDLLRCRSR